MHLVDSHCHLDFPIFDHDRTEVLHRAAALGVQRFVLAAVTRQHWSRLWQTVNTHQGCYGTLGLHPYFLAEHQPEDLHELRTLLQRYRGHSKLCAIGEIGLDFHLPELEPTEQQFYFVEQLKLAQEFKLPVIIHARKAHAQVIKTLKEFPVPRGGIIHAFNGSYEQAQEYQELGFLVGIGGAYSWPNARKLRTLLPRIPLQQLALETDSPDMPPSFSATSRNSPEYLPKMCHLLANELLQIPATELAKQTTANVSQLFGWDTEIERPALRCNGC